MTCHQTSSNVSLTIIPIWIDWQRLAMTPEQNNNMTAVTLHEDEPISFKVRIVERMVHGKATSAFSIMVSISGKHELMPVIITDKSVRIQTWDTAESLIPIQNGFAEQANICARAPIDNLTGLVARIKSKGGDKYCGYAEMRPTMSGIYWTEVNVDTGNVLLHTGQKAAQAAASDIMDWLTYNSVDWTRMPITETILGH